MQSKNRSIVRLVLGLLALLPVVAGILHGFSGQRSSPSSAVSSSWSAPVTPGSYNAAWAESPGRNQQFNAELNRMTQESQARNQQLILQMMRQSQANQEALWRSLNPGGYSPTDP